MVLAVSASVGLSACADDDLDECLRREEGELLVGMGPENFADPFTFTAELVQADRFATTPPQFRYVFRRANQTQVELLIPDLGFGFPIEVGETYTVDVSILGGVPPASAIRIHDAEGLRYLAVTDFGTFPPGTGDVGRRVFKSGYGALGDAGNLEVVMENATCENRVEDNPCLPTLRNIRLTFRVGGEARVRLWHGEEAVALGWVFHVHKAIAVVAACPELLQDQVSFFVEREGLRTP